MERTPRRIYLFSGKRKSGKDFITDQLFERCDSKSTVIIKISAPIKNHWATIKGLEYDSLLGSSEYKEAYRKEMIEWSEDVRRKDLGYFCQAAVTLFKAESKPIWIVSDIRRKTDIKWFKERFDPVIKTVRILCDDETRRSRGWVYTEGIDDKESECDLDNIQDWDIIINNNGQTNLENIFTNFLEDISNILSSE